MRTIKVRYTTTVTVDLDAWTEAHDLNGKSLQVVKASVRGSITDAIMHLPVKPENVSTS